jgi:hypothetical protein
VVPHKRAPIKEQLKQLEADLWSAADKGNYFILLLLFVGTGDLLPQAAGTLLLQI